MLTDSGPPVVDAQQFLAACNNDAPPPQSVADSIAAACRSWGFFQLVNSGVDASVLQRLTAAMHAFFDLPRHEKAKVQRSADNSMGWTDAELTKQALDLKEVFDFCWVPHPELPADHPANRTIDGANRWPPEQPEFKAALKAYFQEMTRCAFKLLQAFCMGLGLQPDSLQPLFAGGIGFARLNFYEALQPGKGAAAAAAATAAEAVAGGGARDSKPPALGIHHHTDAGFLTILLQDEVPGLEVWHGGRWHSVQPIPGALTVNVGDQCQVLSNDTFEAPLHRVVAPTERRRYSVPFFFNPAPEADIAPLPCFVSEAAPARYRPINWGDFRRRRYAGDYADLGEEVQIAHYRVG